MARKKRRGTRSIIQGHLEKVGSGVFERYKDAITSLIAGNQGVYALYRRRKLYYIGLASDLRGRIKHHLKDKHRGKWDQFSLYIIRKEDHIREVEALLVRIAEPGGNSQKGKLIRSRNLQPELKREVKRRQEEEREKLFEHYAVRVKKGRTVRKQARRARRKVDRPLKGLFPSGKMIYAKYKGIEFKAWVYQNGRIKYQESRYDSPSTAAKAIIDRGAVNGWRFWKYKDEAGNLVPLDNLRKKKLSRKRNNAD